MFYASYVRIADWAARACVLAVVSMMVVKYAEALHVPLGWNSFFGWYWFVEQVPQILFLSLCPTTYGRWRQLYIMLMDLRVALYLLYEIISYSPDLLRHVTGGTSKLLMYILSHHVFHLQRPKAALCRSLLLFGPTVWYAMVQARRGATGIEGLWFRAWEEGEWFLVGVVGVYAVVQLLSVVGIAIGVDVSCRKAFLRQERQGAQH